MSLTMDPEVQQALSKIRTLMGSTERPPRGDWKTRRKHGEAMFAASAKLTPVPSDVATRDVLIRSYDGAEIRLRLFEKKDTRRPGSAVLYLHGGGMVLGNVEVFDAILRRLASQSGVPIVGVDYRLPPEHPHPAPIEDCFAALRWLEGHVDELGVERSRIAVMGDSAGGALAASLAILTRDRQGPRLARQILIYPMLDNLNTKVDPELLPLTSVNWDDILTAWDMLLGEGAHRTDVSPYAAPSRVESMANLPPAYIQAFGLDAFCDEAMVYAQRLQRAHIDVELNVVPGVPHGVEVFVPEAAVSRRAVAERVRILQAL
jgi:acetyl esterase/lipase